ncbi:F0F1 ATP synthase subunit epsilon [Chloroflexota bacterium]
MPKLKLEIVTAERVVYTEEVDAVIAPGTEGQLGILPHHAPLMTALQAGELLVRRGSEEDSLAISGGFLEVRPDRVIVLADSAERAEEIDSARAEVAKKRAEQRLVDRRVSGFDAARCEAALQRAMIRLMVTERVKRRRKL